MREMHIWHVYVLEEKEMAMKFVENPDFTRDILYYFASGKAGFPPEKPVRRLKKRFAKKASSDEVLFHLKVAIDNELVDGKYKLTPAAEGGANIEFCLIAGVTQDGAAYLRRSLSPRWQQALQTLAAAGKVATTEFLVPMLLEAAAEQAKTGGG